MAQYFEDVSGGWYPNAETLLLHYSYNHDFPSTLRGVRDLEARNLITSRIPQGQLEAETPFLNSILVPFLGKMKQTDSDTGLSTPSFAA